MPIALILPSILWLAWQPNRTITVELRPEPGAVCDELHVPQPWTLPRVDRSKVGTGGNFPFDRFEQDLDRFDLRDGARLLFRVSAPAVRFADHENIRVYSPDVYAIVFREGKHALERSSEREWMDARPLERMGQQYPNIRADNGQPVLFGDGRFKASGSNWMTNARDSVIYSADREWLALLSWDGSVFQDTRPGGTYYVDLFQVSTGAKWASISGTFSGSDPEGFAGHGFWTEGPRFLMPVSDDMRRFVLCQKDSK